MQVATHYVNVNAISLQSRLSQDIFISGILGETGGGRVLLYAWV